MRDLLVFRMSFRVYKVFRPTFAGEKRWAYYWIEAGKRHLTMVHPETRERFRSRRDIETSLQRLRSDNVSRTNVAFGELWEFLFRRGSPSEVLCHKQRDGRELSDATITQHHQHWTEHIKPEWGKRSLSEATSKTLDAWLWGLDLSNSNRRSVAITMTVILKEARRRGIIDGLPTMSLPAKTRGGRRAVLLLEEVGRLFPAPPVELERIWPADEGDDGGYSYLAAAACSALMFYGGLRPQEARALHRDQVALDLNAVAITRSMDAANTVLAYAKKGDARDPRHRLALLPDRACSILAAWLDHAPADGPVFVAPRQGIIRRELLAARLLAAAAAAGIPTKGRRLSPYSGRYTYQTVVKPFLDRSALTLLMGHTQDSMTDHYDVPHLFERARQMRPIVKQLNEALG